MKLVVGCGFQEFKDYYNKTLGKLDVAEEYYVKKDPSHLIVWRDDSEILGHAIWHESNTAEHRKRVPRDKEDMDILEKLLGRKKDFVELHEVWLKEEHRGKGYGKQFFEFFEEFIRNRGYDSIIYYADHPAAIAICRQRDYKEEYGLKGNHGRTYHVFYLPLKNLKET